MRFACFALLLTAFAPASGRAAPMAPELAAAHPVFSVERFFLGRTRGEGSLKIMLRGAEVVRVEGNGWVEKDGTLVLEQMVSRGARPAQKRQWRLRPAGPGSYAGTLTDAGGPIQGEVRGNLFHLSYAMKDGAEAEQWIYLQADGRTALNRMRIRKFGMNVAHLEETIRKID